MSEKETKNTEQVVEEAETASAVVDAASDQIEEPEPQVATSPPAAAQAPDKPVAEPRKGSSAIAWLALLLALALAGAAGWSVMEMQRREAVLVGRVMELETVAGQKDTNLEELGERWQRQLQTGLSGLKSDLSGLKSELENDLGGETSRQAQLLQTIQTQLGEQRAELASFSANDRDSWLMAEAEYLLRLANQRLIMAGDTVAAQALLASADNVLRELDDVGLHDVRGAVAADLAAVRAVPEVDIEGIYLRLSALAEQAGNLVIFELPEQEAQPQTEAADNWQGRLEEGYENALLKLSDYIIIRRRDVPMQSLMDPQWEGLVRQNLRMLLEQAQVALLSSNQVLYRESLQRAQHWVAEFFESDEAAARAMAREITQLEDLTIAVTMPDISRSQRALGDVRKQRLKSGGGE